MTGARRNFYRDRREAAHNREFGLAELRPVLTADQALAKAAETLTRAAAERDRLRQGSGAPSLCWHCLRQLQRAPGKGLGLFYFNLVRDRVGVEHRVHGDPCTRLSIADGNSLVTQ